MTSHTNEACHLIRGFQDSVEHNEDDVHGISSGVTRLITAVCLECCFLISAASLVTPSISVNMKLQQCNMLEWKASGSVQIYS